jgi:pimeloyl-ACP methyl ester carboxylesterase
MTYPYILISGVLTTPTIWNLVKPLLPVAPYCFAPSHKKTIKEQAVELHEYLLKMGIHECHLVGHSMGGAIALEYTLLYPERVKNLTLCNTFSKLNNKERFLARLNLLLSLIHFPKEWMLRQTMNLLFSQKATIYVKELYKKMTHQVSSQAFQGQLKACIAFDREKDLKNIEVPTQVIVTKVDRLLSPTHSYKISEGIPHASLTILPTEGHIPLLEQPQLFIKALISSPMTSKEIPPKMRSMAFPPLSKGSPPSLS